MTLFQCRKFQFFNLERVEIDLRIKETLKDSEVKCGTSGRGRILLGDSHGQLLSITRQLDCKTLAETHQFGIIQIVQMKVSPYIFTLGEDELATYSIKIWAEQDPIKNLLLKRTIKLTKFKPPTCFAVHENLQLMVVGYIDGAIQIYREELIRDRNVKPRTLLVENHENGEITGLFIKIHNSSIILFASTKNTTLSFDITSKEKEIKLQTDKSGCDLNCSCYAEGSNDDHFIVGRNDAVYCYTIESRGPCYGFDGEKYLLYYFRGYILIISKLGEETYNLTVFDSENKFVGFSSPIKAPEPIKVAAGEWGSLFLITSHGTFWQLKEKDLQTKMSILYKKNQYDLAIKVAKNNNFDADGMADIFRLYGDHLYLKGDLDGAIKQYCRTVGKLEASYVVRKYLDASRVLNLLEYLEVVHTTGYATRDLTTLLLNCLTKLKLNEKIEYYVKDPSCDFIEPDTAIKVFRRGGMSKQAYQLAIKHELYGSALQILLEDVRDPCKEDMYEILDKIIKDENAEFVLKRFGNALVHLLTQADSKSPESWKKIITLLCESPAKRELVELFIAKKDILIPLLENICQEFESTDGPLMNLLLEAYLDRWSSNNKDVASKEKILALLSKGIDCPSLDWARVLFGCKMFGFANGEIIAYEKLGLHRDLLAICYSAARKDSSLWPEFRESYIKYSRDKNSLWKDAFNLITAVEENDEHLSLCPEDIVEEILQKLIDENLMEPLPILDRLCQTKFKLGCVRSFLTKILDRRELDEDEKVAKKLQDETAVIRDQIKNLKSKPTIFQGSRCSACQQKLEFPSIHFLCTHSFHQQCFESFAVNDKDCPVCLNKNKEILESELNENKPSKMVIDAEFSIRLNSAKSNSFSVLADYLGKGLFKEGDKNIQKEEGITLKKKKSIEKIKNRSHLNYDPQDTRFRAAHEPSSFPAPLPPQTAILSENKPSSNYFETKGNIVRNQPSSVKQSTIESAFEAPYQDNTTSLSSSLPFPRVSHKPSPPPQQTKNIAKASPIKRPTANMSISSAINQSKKSNDIHSTSSTTNTKSAVKNPFEDEEDSSNPFLNEGGSTNNFSSSLPSNSKKDQGPKNPFEDDNDYDSNLNPFSD